MERSTERGDQLRPASASAWILVESWPGAASGISDAGCLDWLQPVESESLDVRWCCIGCLCELDRAVAGVVRVPRRSSWRDEFERGRRQRQRAEQQQQRFAQQIARETVQDAHRAQAQAARDAKVASKEQDEQRRRDNLAAAAEQSERLETRARELSELLVGALPQPVLTVQEMVRPRIPPFDPGEDGETEPIPSPPQVPEGGVLGRGRRRREAIAEYEQALEAHRQRDAARLRRLAQHRDEHQRALGQAQDAAARQELEILDGIAAFEERAVESFAAAAVEALQFPDGIVLEPRVIFSADPRELLIDIKLPGLGIVPVEKSVRYVHAREAFDAKPRPKAEIHEIYLRVIAQLPLAVLYAVFRTFDAEILDSVVLNGILDTRDPVTGQPTTEFLVSVTTSRATFDHLVLDELDPVRCLREGLGAKLSRHPHDVEAVKPFLTFDQAKYRLASLDSTTNLVDIEWGDFEQLVRQLLQVMNGGDARVTRRSRDDGIDGVLFDCDTVTGGEYIVQAKRYRNVVPANDVRALAGVLHDKRANHAIFVATSWFSDDGRRFADNNRVRLIEGPELKFLLRHPSQS